MDDAAPTGHVLSVAIVIHNDVEIAALRRAGQVAAATLATVAERVAPGITTAQIDAWVREDTAARNARPSQLGYHGFPATVCTSVNDVVCHGIPNEATTLQPGDIINLDVTSEFEGFHGDTSRTIVLGQPSADAMRVVETARACLEAGIAAVRPGGRLGDVGAAIAALARARDCHLVTEYGGHGIGRSMHMEPHVPHVGRAGTGPRLKLGMAFTIEPMVTLRRVPLVLDADGWTCRTADGSPSAQFEHTLVVGPSGAEVLTLPPPLQSANGILPKTRGYG